MKMAAHFFCTFLCCCFAQLKHETSRNFLHCSYMFYGVNVVCSRVHFFLLTLIFTFVATSISHFSHRRYKFYMFLFQQNWSALFSISCSSSFSVIHVNVVFKIKSKERNSLIFFVVVAFSSLKVRAAMWFTTKMPGCLKCKLSPDLHEGVDVRRTDNFLN